MLPSGPREIPGISRAPLTNYFQSTIGDVLRTTGLTLTAPELQTACEANEDWNREVCSNWTRFVLPWLQHQQTISQSNGDFNDWNKKLNRDINHFIAYTHFEPEFREFLEAKASRDRNEGDVSITWNINAFLYVAIEFYEPTIIDSLILSPMMNTPLSDLFSDALEKALETKDARGAEHLLQYTKNNGGTLVFALLLRSKPLIIDSLNSIFSNPLMQTDRVNYLARNVQYLLVTIFSELTNGDIEIARIVDSYLDDEMIQRNFLGGDWVADRLSSMSMESLEYYRNSRYPQLLQYIPDLYYKVLDSKVYLSSRVTPAQENNFLETSAYIWDNFLPDQDVSKVILSCLRIMPYHLWQQLLTRLDLARLRRADTTSYKSNMLGNIDNLSLWSLYLNYFDLMTSDSDRPTEAHFELEEVTLANEYYRVVLSTTLQQQLVLMKLLPNQAIPWEIHDKSSQFIRVEAGSVTVNIKKNGLISDYIVKAGGSFTVSAGTEHRVSNDSEVSKLYTIYSLPVHKIDLIQVVQPADD